jgi:uncharacterized membrane protein YccC
MGIAAALRDRIVASDPGLTRLSLALRATAAIAVSLALLLWITRTAHQPMTVAVFGAAIGIMWSVALTDATAPDQQITTLLVWLPAAAGVTLGTFLGPHRVLTDLVFIIVLFISIYVRRYGPRGSAMGMLATLSYFFSLFLHARFSQIPWLLVAITIMMIATYFFRFVFFPNSPPAVLRNGLYAFRARLHLIAGTIGRACSRGKWTGTLRRRLDHHLARLNETALMLDDLLREANASRIRAALLDEELRVQMIAEQARNEPCAPRDDSLAALEQDLRAIAAEIRALDLPSKAWVPRAGFRVGTQVSIGGMLPTTRQAVQITVAAAASIVVGELFSPQRWYWAVLTAFLVFVGTSSAGETLGKAWSRVLGTFGGVIAGILVGALLRGHHHAALGVLFFCLFMVIYATRYSNTVVAFFLTAALSLLYVLLGLFSDQILVLRLVETVIGATFGGAAALLLLPISTRRVLQNVFVEALTRLRTAVDAAVLRLEGDPDADPLTALRAYDEALQSLRVQIEPFIMALRFGRASLPYRSILLLFNASAYYARALAGLPFIAPTAGNTQELERERARIDDETQVAIDAVQGHVKPLEPDVIVEVPSERGALFYLFRLDRTVRRLAQLLSPSSER